MNDTVCKQVLRDQPTPSSAYVDFTWFIFALAVLLWIVSLPLLWLFRLHQRMRAVRPFWLNMFMVCSNLLWTLLCLNLVVDSIPCALVPFCMIIGLAGMALNFCLRMIVFAIESQFAKNAHLFKFNQTSGEDGHNTMLVAPYLRSMTSLIKLLFGFARLETLDYTEIAKAKQSYASIMIATLIPGLIAILAVWTSSERYFTCTNCAVTSDDMFAFLGMAMVYVLLTGRTLFVLWSAKFPDEQGILHELKMCWIFAGLPLVVIGMFWVVDIDGREMRREFAYEWLFQIDMLVFWWFVVGAQMYQIRKRAHKAAVRAKSQRAKSNTLDTPNNDAASQFSLEDLKDLQFTDFMISHFAIESLLFMQDVATYKLYFAEQNSIWRIKKSLAVFDTYVKPGAAMEVNISDTMRRKIITDMTVLLSCSNTIKAGLVPPYIDMQMLEQVFDFALSDIRKNIVFPLWLDYMHQKSRQLKASRKSILGSSLPSISIV